MTDRYPRSGRTPESWIKFYDSQYDTTYWVKATFGATNRNLVRYYLVTSTLNVADPRGWIWPPQDKLLLRSQLRAVVVVPLLNISWTVFSYSHNDMNLILVQEN